ncbi:protein neprosin-like [Aristolochia californica]|uniref:protein neprosin-like n=1 Tax=Aristolochia californica TaxID=171875 RepID=UPI0035DECE61
MAAATRPGWMNVLLSLLGFFAVFNEAGGISTEEYLGMKKYLKSINKPALKSIKIESGDVFDCVDIYKQPAFDHPLLKNYTIQMRPSFVPKRRITMTSSSNMSMEIDIGLPGGGCPKGTVPIRRVQMQHLLGAGSVSNFGKKHYRNFSSTNILEPWHSYHWGVIRTKRGEFYGTAADVNVWKPEVQYDEKYSSAQVWLIGGPEDDLNTVEAGWMVNGQIFGDRETRLFAFWTADGHRNTGCINTLCPGFVSVNERYPLGLPIRPVSVRHGAQFHISVYVFKDVEVWWLLLNNEPVGFWPKKLFNHLNDKIDVVQWGGEVYNPQGPDAFRKKKAIVHRSQSPKEYPPMGSGLDAKYGWQVSSFMKAIKVLNSKKELDDAPTDTEYYLDKGCYRVWDHGQSRDPKWSRNFYFGGPGGHSPEC